MSFDVVVVGSVNRDLAVVVERHPVPGETVLGERHVYGPGGKGANQAVAAARLGASVGFVGVVGDDEDGRAMLDNLRDEGVDVSGVQVSETSATGLAIITVDGNAENSIVVSPGANLELDERVLEASRSAIASAAVVLAQLEVPTRSIAAAAAMTDGRFLLNPAPARDLTSKLLGDVDVLLPNRSELGMLASIDEPVSVDQVREGVTRLGTPAEVVVTLGGDGAYIASLDTIVEPPRVDAVDTTGAGDAFCGAMAAQLSGGAELVDAVRFAVAAGAMATTALGAQAALPGRARVESLLGG